MPPLNGWFQYATTKWLVPICHVTKQHVHNILLNDASLVWVAYYELVNSLSLSVTLTHTHTHTHTHLTHNSHTNTCTHQAQTHLSLSITHIHLVRDHMTRSCCLLWLLGKGGQLWCGLSYPLDRIESTVTNPKWMSKNMGLMKVSVEFLLPGHVLVMCWSCVKTYIGHVLVMCWCALGFVVDLNIYIYKHVPLFKPHPFLCSISWVLLYWKLATDSSI